MLKEIYSSVIKQKTIKFHKGLNVVLGDNNASNSIGKSTMLLIIDYVFGGDTYIKSDVIDHIGQHDICFCLEFNGELFYFKRKTEQSQTIFITDESYNDKQEITLEEYKKRLLYDYCIAEKNISFRELVGLYSRIYGKSNYDEKLVLSSFSKQSISDSILCLIKTFGKYPEIQSRVEAKKHSEERYKSFCNAAKMNFVNAYSKKSDVQIAQKEVERLLVECQNLEHQLLTDTTTLTPIQFQKISVLKDELAKLLAMKVSHRNKLGKLQANIGKLKSKVTINVEKLKGYFPSVNIIEVEKVNKFHEGLVNELHSTIFGEIKKEQNLILTIEQEEEVLKKEIDSVVTINNASKVVLDKLIELRKDIGDKEKSIAGYKKREDLKKEKKDASEMFENTQNLILAGIQNQLNNEILLLNEKIEGKKKQAPVFSLSSKNYSYQCTDDSGTGTNYKNLVIFDLAILKKTILPFIIHDTLLLKNIDKRRMDAIMNLYSEEKNKQIFISFDELADFNITTQKIVEDNKVISLAPGGNELFGMSWNKKK